MSSPLSHLCRECQALFLGGARTVLSLGRGDAESCKDAGGWLFGQPSWHNNKVLGWRYSEKMVGLLLSSTASAAMAAAK